MGVPEKRGYIRIPELSGSGCGLGVVPHYSRIKWTRTWNMTWKQGGCRVYLGKYGTMAYMPHAHFFVNPSTSTPPGPTPFGNPCQSPRGSFGSALMDPV